MTIREVDGTLRYPYAVISDVHCHNWSAFSYRNAEGINNRLQHILDGIELAATTLKAAGGSDIVITGDLFHTRGSVKPSVLNPTKDKFADLCKRGFKVKATPGNHDLEDVHTSRLGNSMTSLEEIEGFTIYNEPTLLGGEFLFLPWFEKAEKVQNFATKSPYQKRKLTLFCHVGLNGVVPGKIGNTLNPDVFPESFKYVFCGHFHNHVSFNSRVFSVGALTHQTWGDVGSKAGFLIVYEDRVEHFETNAPKFIDLDWFSSATITPDYVRLKGMELTDDQAEDMMQGLLKQGALAVLDQSTRPSIIEKTYEHAIEVDMGFDHMLEAYCKNTFGDRWKEVYEACLRLKS